MSNTRSLSNTLTDLSHHNNNNSHNAPKSRAPPIMITTASQTTHDSNAYSDYIHKYTTNNKPISNPYQNTIRIVSDKECTVCYPHICSVQFIKIIFFKMKTH